MSFTVCMIMLWSFSLGIALQSQVNDERLFIKVVGVILLTYIVEFIVRRIKK